MMAHERQVVKATHAHQHTHMQHMHMQHMHMMKVVNRIMADQSQRKYSTLSVEHMLRCERVEEVIKVGHAVSCPPMSGCLGLCVMCVMCVCHVCHARHVSCVSCVSR
jgi:hypothetical protein